MGLKAMWVSPAMWTTTGYGVQSKRTVPRLQQLPEVDYIGIACNSGLSYGGVKYAGVEHWPLWGITASDVALRSHLAVSGCDTVFTLLDVWVLSNDFATKDAKGNRFRWLPYAPIDAWPLSMENYAQLVKADIVLVNSYFGKLVCEDAGLSDVRYMPHMVDTELYKPKSDHQTYKQRYLGFPNDSFVVGMVAANKGRTPMRKGFEFALRAFAAFAQKHDDAFLYLHTDLMPSSSENADLFRIINLYGLKDKARGLDPYTATMGVGDDEMVGIYNSFDVVLSASRAESCNVPLLEGQSCGVPVVGSKTSGQTEHIGVGWSVECLTQELTPQASHWEVPDWKGLAEALELSYQYLSVKSKKKAMRKKAREFALNFDSDTVCQTYWSPLIKELAG